VIDPTEWNQMLANSEEKLLPVIRARIANKLLDRGFKPKEIATVLRVTPAAVTQYLKGKRGSTLPQDGNGDKIIDALADKAAHRIRTSAGPVETVEFFDVAYQLLSATRGQHALELRREGKQRGNSQSISILRDRLQLELKAAEKCLDLANRTRDDYNKLLLRMIASDSIRHADIVSQLISWSQADHESATEPPPSEFLNEMAAIEDKASEASLSKSVRIPHAIAMLLLESIDMDEEKHDKLIQKMLRVTQQSRK
jgi:predicted transcriptional regulator